MYTCWARSNAEGWACKGLAQWIPYRTLAYNVQVDTHPMRIKYHIVSEGATWAAMRQACAQQP